MTQKISPFIESKFGWEYGESGWNSGMDENLTKFSFLFDRNIDAIVSTLPSTPVNGQAFFLTTDNRMYFRVESTWYSTPTPKWFEFQIRSTGVVYRFDGTSISVVESPSSFDSRIDALDVTVSGLGTAAFEDSGFFATQAELDVVEAQSQSYTDALVAAAEERFEQELSAAGYTSLGSYAAGLSVVSLKQYFRRDGRFYRAAASLDLPYTLTGTWVTDSANFVLLGDDVLRQDLASATDPANGAGMVALRQGGFVADAIRYVTPQMFNAIGDGVTDDTQSVLDAIDTGLDVNFGGVDNIYLLSSSIDRLRPGRKYYGNGATIKSGGEGVPLIDIDGVENFHIEGVKLDGNSDLHTSPDHKTVIFKNCRGIRFLNNEVTDTRWNSVIFDRCDNLICTGNFVYESLGNSINVFGSDTVLLSGNMFINIGGSGETGRRAGSAIKVSDESSFGTKESTNVLIDGNVIDGTTDTAIYVGSDDDLSNKITVTNNCMQRVGKSAINVNGGVSDVVVANNRASIIGAAAINVSLGVGTRLSSRIVIDGNIMHRMGESFEVKQGIMSIDNFPFGLTLDNVNSAIISNNVFDTVLEGTGDSNNRMGVKLRRVSDSIVCDNIVRNTASSGIVVETANNTSLVNNTVLNTGGFGITVGGFGSTQSNDVSVKFNKILDTRDEVIMTHGIRLFTPTVTADVIGNNISDLIPIPIDNQSTVRATISENIIGDGVRIQSGLVTNCAGFHTLLASSTVNGISGVNNVGYRIVIIASINVTITHGTGENSIALKSGSDMLLLQDQCIEVIFRGGRWFEI